MSDNWTRLLVAGAAITVLAACGSQGGTVLPASNVPAVSAGDALTTDHSCGWYSHHGLGAPSSCGITSPTSAPTPQPTAAASSQPTASAKATAQPTSLPTAGSSSGCFSAWSATAVYTGGARVTYNGVNYTAAYWTQGNNPATSNGPALSGQPWISNGACMGGTTPTSAPTLAPTAAPTVAPTKAPTAGPTTAPTKAPTTSPTQAPSPSGPPPSSSFIFSQYKDIGTNLNWNTNVLSTAVTGSLQPLLSVMPQKNTTVTLAFATGTCGSENWAGISAASFIAANMQTFASAGKYYIVSTGGAAGTFLCPSTSGFLSFVQSYYTSRMLGVDFDVEAGQSQSQVTSLVQDVKAAEAAYPTLRFSFTVPTLGGNASPSLGTEGIYVMNAINSVGLSRYTINLMAMDYGSATAGNCVVIGGACEMGQSANQAAVDLHAQYGVPYSEIELTPMVGGNDTRSEIFTLADASTMSSFVRQNGLAGVHFWSFDRDMDCALGAASSTCNSYGQAGTLGFTNAFVSDLGL